MEWKTLTLLTVGYFVYLVIGAAVFYSIERPLEKQKCLEAQQFKESVLNYTSQNTSISADQIDQFFQKVYEYYNLGISLRGQVKCPNRWDFQSSVFFSGTIITTIGYGHITPTTQGSQAFCVIYALMGIPLFAIMFSGLGDLFGRGIKRFSDVVDKKDMRPWVKNLVIFSSFAAAGFTFFCCIPSIIFTAVEKWPYSISMYYSIITLTTIGFGDYVAGNNPDVHYISMYRVMVYFWILFGLAFMATFVSIISTRLKQHGLTERDKVEYEAPDGIDQEQTEEDDNPRIRESAEDLNEKSSIAENVH